MNFVNLYIFIMLKARFFKKIKNKVAIDRVTSVKFGSTPNLSPR